MRVAICDDVILQLELLNHYVKSWADCEGIRCIIELFKSAETFHFKWSEDKSFDIILLDIEMGDVNIRFIKNISPKGITLNRRRKGINN